ncbi:MAG TPA: protein kinase [Candidatus Acidoferrales bacterium]|nr:protein kinase [Candidatus Acidoferrales bacterium]
MDDAPSSLIGRTLGQYRVLEKLGAGGMGEVYRAHDTRLERDVAIKVLPTAGPADDAARKRFRKEALALSKLNHPNIATIFDFDSAEGLDFLVMELVQGEPLSSRIGGVALPEKTAAALGSQIAEALEESHEHGVVHRDLKPANIVVTPKDQAKVLDFGLARLIRAPQAGEATASLTATPAAAGTLPYMAPEQLQGQEADPRSDLYALGAVLYEMATGQRPFQDTLPTRLVNAILHEPPVAPRARNERVSPELERIILKCLEKDPSLRYHSGKEVSIDLRRLGAPASVTSASSVREPPSRAARGWRTPAFLAFGILSVVLLAGIAVGLILMRTRTPQESAGSAPIRSLAVLPLENLSHDPEQDYFADGMTEELTADLGQIGALRVISRTSVMQYKGTRKTMPEIGRELNVDALIEGSVLRAGQRVRITAQLVRASPEQHLWAKSYEGDLGDVLSLQSSVAREIAGEIKVALSPQDQARLAASRKVDPKAYEAYLQGRYAWANQNGADLRKSIEYYQQALSIDPNYAAAYAGLADTYSALSDFYLPPREAMPKAAEAANKALQLDESLAEAHNALALIHFFYDWDWPGAEREFQRALELNPSFADAHHFYALFLACMGRHQESSTQIEQALQLAPFSGPAYVDAVNAYWLSRNYDQAIALGKKGIAIDPQNAQLRLQLALAYATKGESAEAIAQGEMGRKMDDSPILYGFLGTVYASAGRRAEAEKVLSTLAGNLSHRYVCPYELGTISLGLGRKNEFFSWVEKAIEVRSVCMPFLLTDPRLDSVRSDPRYQQLLVRMKFPI